jgi:thymidylate synthase
MKTKFYNAREAFIYFYNEINSNGVVFGDTKALFNVGFTLENPSKKNINVLNPNRKFNLEYAEAEWQWYLSGDPSIDKLGEINGSIPPIWERMADSERKVRSNYGWQWERNHQLDKVVAMLKSNPETRQAVISIYDGKEISTYRKDTPCTYAVQFTILDSKLHMAVLMRSNDLWFGFCNDQYCFASLQELVASRLSIELGTYYHFAHNLHLYNNKLK